MVNISIDQDLETMEQEALDIGRVYFKGFDDLVGAVLGSLSNYGLRQNQGHLQAAYEALERMEQIYSELPLFELEGKRWAYPVLTIRGLLSEFRAKVDRHVAVPSDTSLQIVIVYGNAIIAVGRLFKEDTARFYRKIKTHAGGEDFKIPINDIGGANAYFPENIPLR